MVWLSALSLATFLGAAAISFALLLCLRPLLAHYALAKPNARSSHKKPTPQGGGIAVVFATMFVLAIAAVFFPDQIDKPLQLTVVFASAIGLALVGASDDVRPLDAIPRLILQTTAVAAVITVLPSELRAIPALPWWLERAILLLAGVWFVNVVNFMDGIDWLTVAEVVPVAAGLTIFGLMGMLPQDATLVAVGLCGAMIGFAPFNRPIAKLFLGDVGSLPIGLILGWLLILLAGGGYLAAALLLPLYYLADATVTLLRRLAKGERVTQAHRSHFYQRAMDNGFSVKQILARVLTVNVVLVGLAAITVANQSRAIDVFMVLAGSMVVSLLLWNFSRGPRRTFSSA